MFSAVRVCRCNWCYLINCWRQFGHCGDVHRQWCAEKCILNSGTTPPHHHPKKVKTHASHYGWKGCKNKDKKSVCFNLLLLLLTPFSYCIRTNKQHRSYDTWAWGIPWLALMGWQLGPTLLMAVFQTQSPWSLVFKSGAIISKIFFLAILFSGSTSPVS